MKTKKNETIPSPSLSHGQISRIDFSAELNKPSNEYRTDLRDVKLEIQCGLDN